MNKETSSSDAAATAAVYLLDRDHGSLLIAWSKDPLVKEDVYELQMASRSSISSFSSSSMSSDGSGGGGAIEGDDHIAVFKVESQGDKDSKDWVYIEKTEVTEESSSSSKPGGGGGVIKSVTDLEWTTLSSTLKATTIKKKNLVRDCEYYFRVRGMDSKSNLWTPFSPPSVGMTVLSIDSLLMDAPELDSRDASSITVKWKPVDKCAGYRLRFRLEGDPWQIVQSIINNTQVKKKSLLSNTNYFFSVMPLFAADSSSEYQFSLSSAPLTVATISPKMLAELPDTLLTKSKTDLKGIPTQATSSELLSNSKIISIYFSGHWCGPCRQFTPMLASMYLGAKKEGLPFEVIFCSADHDEAEFDSYYRESMPWLAIPYNDPKREGLQAKHRVNGIPCLIVFDAATGEIIDSNGRPGGPEVVRGWIQKAGSRSNL